MALLPFLCSIEIKDDILKNVDTSTVFVSNCKEAFLFLREEKTTWEKTALTLIQQLIFYGRHLSYNTLGITQWHLNYYFLMRKWQVSKVSWYKAFFKKSSSRFSSHLIPGSTINCTDSDKRLNTQSDHPRLTTDLNGQFS